MSIMSWIGVALIVVGSGFMWREHRLILSSQIVPGRVIELVPSHGSKGGTMYAPKIRFTTIEGQEIIFTTTYSTSYPGVSVGDHVHMAYDQVNPKKARILRFGYTFGFWYCVVGVGLLLVFISYGYLNGNDWIRKMYLSSDPSPPG